MATYDELKENIESIKVLVREADEMAKRTADLLRGRLQYLDLSTYMLAELKRELKNFDSKRMRWKK